MNLSFTGDQQGGFGGRNSGNFKGDRGPNNRLNNFGGRGDKNNRSAPIKGIHTYISKLYYIFFNIVIFI